MAAGTIQLIFSGTKGLAAGCVLLLVERGAVSLDQPLSRYWPDFAAAGKDAITVADVLSHQARLPGADFRRVDPLLVPGAEKIWNSAEYRSAGLAAVGGFAHRSGDGPLLCRTSR